MRLPVLAALLACALATLSAQTPAIDFTTIGPKVGETVPDFELPDQHGTPRKLSSLLGPRGAMLVFYRSADW
jgi:cytochrome oxidase Cu insertion factor (SCO1/SenC/PrrC family)